MSDLITRTAKLQPRVKRTKALPSFATTYVFEADDYPELGNLYIVLEVLVNAKQGQNLADLIIETAGDAYYNEESEHEKLLPRFEKAIKATNKALAAYTDKGNGGWVGRLSAVIAVIAEDEIHVTQTGSAEAHLYRSSRVSHITDGLQSSGPHRPITTFGGIASGNLEAHDRLLIATPALYHQVPQADLKSIVEDSTANGAITKLSERIADDEDADRVAALVVEATTADIMAMNVRPTEPEEVQVGQADKPLDIAKAAAGPAVDSILSKTKEMSAKASSHTRSKLLPRMRELGLSAAAWLRSKLSTQMGRRIAGAAVIILVVALGWSVVAGQQNTQFDQALTKYDQAYSAYVSAQEAQANGDKEAARTKLAGAQKDLQELTKTANRSGFDGKLSKRSHPEDDPASVDKLLALVQTQLDLIEGLFTLKPTELIALSQLNPKPTHIELIDNKLYLASDKNSPVYSYDLTAGTMSTIAEASAGLGNVTASAVSSTNDGVYFLTDEPAVWFLKSSDNSLTKQSLSNGAWPAGKAIGSYAGNLYILASDGNQVYKHVPTQAGFSAPATYFSGAVAPEAASSTGMAVDGSIYTSGDYGLKRFISGRLDVSATLPDSLKQPASVHSLVDSGTIVLRDGQTQRIGLVTATDASLTFSKQLKLDGVATLAGLTGDPKGTVLYVLSPDKLYKVTLP
jgi:tetratricopeptide (TPR) repeat protein